MSQGLLGFFRQFFPSSPPSAPLAPHAVPEMREHRVLCGGIDGLYQMAYSEWGDPANPRVLICVHGLTRNRHDFDALARALAGDYRVICPDVVGRGSSDWLPNKEQYGFPRYVADMVNLIARLDVLTVDWVGTSMGGLIGMMLAAQAGSPIRRMVLNDVGPRIRSAALRRIGEYVGTAPRFASIDQADAYLRQNCAGFGPLSNEQWHHLTRHSLRRDGDGWVMAYDPAIGQAFRAAPLLLDIDLWPVYEQMRCATLALRGAESDLLDAQVFAQMAGRGPQARLVEFAGVGHAPMLMDEAQIAVVREFLLADQASLARSSVDGSSNSAAELMQ